MIKKTTLEVSDLRFQPGVGEKRAIALTQMGISTLKDMLFFFPKSYIDRNSFNSIKELYQKLNTSSIDNEALDILDTNSIDVSIKTESTIVAKIISKDLRVRSNRKKYLKLVIRDTSGFKAFIFFWNFADYFDKQYFVDMTIAVNGSPSIESGVLSFTHPDIMPLVADSEIEFADGRILPRYIINEKYSKIGITLNLLRQLADSAIKQELYKIQDSLPKLLIDRYGILNIQESIKNLHFPESRDNLNSALYRMKFDEIFYYEILLASQKKKIEVSDAGIFINPKSKSARMIYDNLPFELTKDQKRAIREIAADFESGKPMNRLLQGDVGSGKTLVATLAIMMAIDSSFQALIVAPTEILAEQHFATLSKLTNGLNIDIVLLTGSLKVAARRDALMKLEAGIARIAIGTHALFQEKVKYNNLAFVVIDEQHRFGVAQRADLKRMAQESLEIKKDKSGKPFAPHILNMTATPIPRTLTMTYFSNLEVSVIKTMPKNRKPIKTDIAFESNSKVVFDFIRKEVQTGRQAYIVYPLVSKSEKMELKSAVERYEMLSTEVFSDLRCGLLHGQMDWKEKEQVMRDFAEHKFDVLVSTTVIEVGIDVPNASVMLIENAERFGLSQLHQLRGRVGRGEWQSYCILLTKDNFQYQIGSKQLEMSEKRAAVIRLKAMRDSTDGFVLSEIDLKLRGPGDILGAKQSGLPDFNFIDLVSDISIINEAKEIAYALANREILLSENDYNTIKKQLKLRYEKEDIYYDIA